MERLKKFVSEFVFEKNFTLVVLLFSAVFAFACGRVSAVFFADRASAVTVERMSAGVGTFSQKYPGLTEEFIKSFVSPDYNYISGGEEELRKYGYSADMDFNFLKEYSGIKNSFVLFITAAVGLGILFALAFCGIRNKIFANSVRRLTICASRANSGKEYNPPERLCGLLVPLSSEIKCFCERNRGLLDKIMQEKENLKNFISDFSHQLKTPVSILSMNLQIIDETENISKNDMQKLVSIGLEQIERTNRLIQGMLKLARLDCDSVLFENTQTDLAQTCNLAADNFSLQAVSKNISIEKRTQPVYFPHDGNWLYEAVCNIIKNSLEHTAEGGKISVSVFSTPITAVIEIADNGEGIPKESIPLIFRRFYNKTNGTNPGSVGIGLAISKSIVEKMGGKITCVSKEGRGTKMSICFLYNANA